MGLSTFEGSSVVNAGRTVRFRFAAGVSYDVPIDFMVSWFDQTQYTRSSSGWVEARSDDRFPPSPILALRCRRLDDGSVAFRWLNRRVAHKNLSLLERFG
jgi:hypothetical protein